MNTETYPKTSATAGGSDKEAAKSELKGLRDDAERTAKDAGQAVADEARHRADAAKEGVAAEISSVSSALRRASEELRGGSPQERTFAAAATALADVSDTVRDKDLGEVVHDLSDFARRNPMAFLGGAALLGFAGVRMAKASRRARLDDDSHQGSQAYGTTTGSRAPSATASPTPSAGSTSTSPGMGVGTASQPNLNARTGGAS